MSSRGVAHSPSKLGAVQCREHLNSFREPETGNQCCCVGQDADDGSYIQLLQLASDKSRREESRAEVGSEIDAQGDTQT